MNSLLSRFVASALATAAALSAADMAPPVGPNQYLNPLYFITLAGSGSNGHTNGPGTAAQFDTPAGIAVDASGDVLVTDRNNHVIRRISRTGVVSTYAGLAGTSGSSDGSVQDARFFHPSGLAFDADGILYVVDKGNHTIRRITPAGVVSTVAGQAGQPGTTDGPGNAARFKDPHGIAVASTGTLFVTDRGNHTVRRIAPNGAVTTHAGTPGTFGFVDGPGILARFREPTGIAVDGTGRVFVADAFNQVIRVISAVREVSTYAGTPQSFGNLDGPRATAKFYLPTGLALGPSGALHVADENHLIRVISPAGIVSTLAGFPNGLTTLGPTASRDGRGPDAFFASAGSLARDADGNLYLTEYASHTIRRSVFPPAFRVQPTGLLVTAGASAVLTAEVASDHPLSFQWRRNGEPVPGATTRSLTLGSVQPADAGLYTLVATNVAGSVVSQPANLAVIPPAITAPVIRQQPTDLTATAGRTIWLMVSADGTAPFTYQWFKDNAGIAGATFSAFAITSAQPEDAGSYHVVISNAAGSVTSRSATVTITSVPPPPPPPPAEVKPPSGSPPPVTPVVPTARLSNLSIRTSLAADQTVIVGLAVQGGARDVLVRAVGPGLASFGVAGALADPRVELFDGAKLALANDNWSADLASGFASVGAFPLQSGSRDAAFRRAIDGAVSIQARGAGAGIVLLEAYDFGSSDNPRLVNVSARNHVGTGDEILVAGFTIAGTGATRLLIRAVGPGLTGFGVTGTLADPVLELFSGANRVAGNDNWSADLAAHAARVGAFALNPGSADAALVVALPPGAYTAQVRGAGATTGEALVEIYELP